MQTAKQMLEQTIQNVENGLKELQDALERTDANHPIQNLLIRQKITEMTSKLDVLKDMRNKFNKGAC